MLQQELAGVPDAEVVFVDSLPEVLEGSQRVGDWMQIRPGAILLRVPELGAFFASDARTIQVAPLEDADPKAIDLFLHGSARAAILHLRGDLPLHAACLLPPDAESCMTVCGVSGAGKSTLAAEMHRRGWKVLADDSTRLTFPDGKALAWPSHRGIKLWKDACDRLGLASEDLPNVRKGLDKFFYPVTTDGAPVLVATVIELNDSAPGLTRIRDTATIMAMITRHTFQQQQVAPLGALKQHLRAVGMLSGQICCGLLGGSRQSSVMELGDCLEEAAGWKPSAS